ncbi:MAG TPA: SEC-C metal-binding domain-containing protein [Candidatus Sulfotelmatobacter sp.]|nr:SEC-C metal-binding domain-containing protein [Candidatus Sulfotelmatobacter sp.]
MNAASVASDLTSDLDIQRFYPDFSPVEVPSGTSARRAWIGSIQPFEEDTSAKLLLRALDENRVVEVDRGTVRAISCPKASHPLEARLVYMQISFHLLLLEYAAPVHPRVYGWRPKISRYTLPGHPHLRGDQQIEYAGAYLPALCVYSAAEFKYVKRTPPLVEFLDQTATFLAKQLIWIRTRQLFEIKTDRLIYAPASGARVLDLEPRAEDNVPGISRHTRPVTRIWKGYWPGAIAPAGPTAHVAAIDPNSECWCGRGIRYRDCHFQFEKRMAFKK